MARVVACFAGWIDIGKARERPDCHICIEFGWGQIFRVRILAPSDRMCVGRPNVC
eukprot:SAG31_NODE_27445_length_426_cov_0.623853_1_plen_54_part_10